MYYSKIKQPCQELLSKNKNIFLTKLIKNTKYS